MRDRGEGVLVGTATFVQAATVFGPGDLVAGSIGIVQRLPVEMQDLHSDVQFCSRHIVFIPSGRIAQGKKKRNCKYQAAQLMRVVLVSQ